MVAPSASPAPPENSPAPSLLETAKGLWRELPELLNDRVELLSLELHRAGLVLAQTVALGIAAAILVSTAWLVLWGLIAATLVAAGLSWLAALSMVFAVNLLGCWWVVCRLRALLPLLGLPATRRHLMFRAPVTAFESWSTALKSM